MKKLFGLILVGGLAISAPAYADKNEDLMCIAAFSVARDALYTLNLGRSDRSQTIVAAQNNIFLSQPSGYFRPIDIDKRKAHFNLVGPILLATSIEECLDEWQGELVQTGPDKWTLKRKM